MFTVENKVGKLVECVLRSPLTEPDVDAFDRLRAEVVTRIVGPRAVCTDLSGVGVLAPAASERLIEILKRQRGGPARIAFLLPPRAVAMLQIERIVKATGNPSRRTFSERQPLMDWLREELTPAELARLQAFLGAP